MNASISESTIAAILELRNSLAERRKPVWQGIFPHGFLKITPGNGTVLSFEFEDAENCRTPGGYRIADCGSATLIALSFDFPPAVGSNIPIGRNSDTMATVYRGVVDGPGRAGCFGIAESGVLRIVDVRSDLLIATVEADYKPISLFNPSSRLCDPYQLHGTYRFTIRQAKTAE